MKTTITLHDGTLIVTTYSDTVHSLLNHMSMGGQGGVGFVVERVPLQVRDVARVEIEVAA